MSKYKSLSFEGKVAAKLTDDGSLAWTIGGWKIFDGKSERKLDKKWGSAVLFDSLCL